MKNRIELFMCFLFYKTFLELTYFFGVSPIFGYSGFIWKPNYLMYIVSLVVLFIVCIMSPVNVKKPSTILFHLLLVFLYIPTIGYFWMTSENFTFFALETIMIVLLASILRFPLLKVKYIEGISGNFFKVIFVLYGVITSVLFFKRGGFDTRTLDFDKVYDVRSENNISGIFGYLMNWTTKAFAPFYFAFGFFQGKKIYYIFVTFFQLSMYLAFGNKAFLFSIFSMIYMYWILKRSNPLNALYISFGFVNILSVLANNLLKIDFLFRAIPYRMLFVPSQIQFRYYDFFSVREKLHFAETFIGKLLNINTGYSVPVPILISRHYLKDPNSMSFANTGIFSDAYANGGVIAMIVITALFGLILLLIDSLSIKISPIFVICSLSYIIFVINDTSLLTTLITGGLLIMLLLLYFLASYINSEGREKKESRV